MNFFVCAEELPTGFGESRLGSSGVLCPVFFVVLRVSQTVRHRNQTGYCTDTQHVLCVHSFPDLLICFSNPHNTSGVLECLIESHPSCKVKIELCLWVKSRAYRFP